MKGTTVRTETHSPRNTWKRKGYGLVDCGSITGGSIGQIAQGIRWVLVVRICASRVKLIYA